MISFPASDRWKTHLGCQVALLLFLAIGPVRGETVPELFHYRFSGTGTSVPNLASHPPAGTATATLRGGLTQTGADLNAAGNGHSVLGTGIGSDKDCVDTGWATNLTGTSWTISFVTSNITSSSTLFYVFGEPSSGSLRCFTNGVAGPNNWILRGDGMSDVLVSGAATVATHRTTLVYDQAAGNIKAYVDGALIDTVAQGAALSYIGPGPFKVAGYGANVGLPANGLLDDFRIYSRALSEAEVQDLDVDITPPTADVPPILIVNAGPTGRAAIGDLTGNVTASDDSGDTPTVTQNLPPDTVYPLGSYPIEFTVKDPVNNAIVVTSVVRVAFAPVPDPVVTLGTYQAGPIVKRVATGAPVPGAGTDDLPADATFGAFSSPAISDTRQLVTRATLLAGGKMLGGIYVEDGAGAGQVVAVQNGVALDDGGAPLAEVTFKSFGDPITSPSEAIAFAARLQGKGAKTGDDGVWTDLFSSPLEPRLILREGSEVPGLGGARLKAVSSFSILDGELLALLTLQAAPGSVSAGNDTVLLRLKTPVDGAPLLREGEPLSGFPGSVIKSFTVLSPALGSNGHGRWHTASAVLAKVTLASKEVLLVSIAADNSVTKLLSTADFFPSVDPQARWKSFGLPVVGSAGAPFATLATLLPIKGVIFPTNDLFLLTSPTGTAWTITGRESGPLFLAPDTPRFASFFDPVVNADGKLAFLATLQGTGVKPTNKTAIFSGLPGSLAIAARLGDPAPDETGTDTAATWSKFATYALPDGLGIVFLAETKGGDTTPKNKLALWAANAAGQVRRVLRTGTSLTVSGPTITKITLLDAPRAVFGTTRSFNATRSVAAQVTFSDKSQSLIRIDLP